MKLRKMRDRIGDLWVKYYPITIQQGVFDVETDETLDVTLTKKADHGYDSAPKTLKEVDEAKVDKTSIVGETGQGETSVMSQKAVTDEIAQLAGEVSELELKDVVQSDKIKDIENVISTMNPNQSAQLSVSGRKIVSLPKNASNGGMSVKLEGLTAENLVVNGDFRNGTEGYTASYSVNSILNGNIINTGNGDNKEPNLYKYIDLVDTNKYYIRTRVRVTNSECVFLRQRCFGVSPVDYQINYPVQNKWYDMNRVVQATETGKKALYIMHNYTDSATANGKVAEFEHMFFINLTTTFGAGNEPDLATCDAMFSDYFEGVKSFVPTGRVRSVGKNLFPELLELGTINRTTGANTASTTEARTSKIPFSGGRFRFSAPSGYRVLRVFMYDRSGLFLGLDLLAATSSPYTTMASTRYIRVTFDKSAAALTSTDIDTLKQGIQIEKGEIQTSYTKYVDTSIYLTAPELRSNGTVKDEIRKGANGYELVKRISEVDGTVLATPVISPISHGGILNSAANGTVCHEPVIADAGVYGTNMPILLTDYPIASLEEIIKHENGVDTYLDVSTAVIAGDKLSFTHPDLASGDLVLFTYAFDKESTNGNITATFYDSNVVKIDTVTGKAYKITDVVTNGVLTRTLTEV